MPERRLLRRSTITSTNISLNNADLSKKRKRSSASPSKPVKRPSNSSPVRKGRRIATDLSFAKSIQSENNDSRVSSKTRGGSVNSRRKSNILQPSNAGTSTASSPSANSTTAPTDSKPSPMKTRRVQKSRDAVPRCTLCFKTKGDLMSCTKCNLNYHLQKCLHYSNEMIANAEKLSNWLCPKCVRCTVCSNLIDDVNNRECNVCLRAWHGSCSLRNKGHGTAQSWTCERCCKQLGIPKESPPQTSSKNLTTTLQDFPVWSPLCSPINSPISSPLKRGRGRPKGSISGAKRNILNDLSPLEPQDEVTTNILAARNTIWDNLLEHHKQNEPGSSRSPRKRDKSKSPEKKLIRKLTTPEDLDIFQKAKARYMSELAKSQSNEEVRETTVGKWIYIGGQDMMKALYDSPYPTDVRKSETIYICPYCLYPTGDLHVYRIHRDNCPFHHPPGNEIYREEDLSFFEVDGALEKNYCRNLCLLAKLFISSKTLHHEVDTFFFYILTEIIPEGCRIVGYFSKEKNPSKNNNLSCLLTLPNESKKGYGKLLIDLSYRLSELEFKVGSPEHPLSDLGLFAYQGYWRSSILCYLRSVRNLPHTSIKNMALTTRIHPTDIVNQLLRDRLLVYKDGNYFVKTGRRAYKWPLSICRRRALIPEKLHWEPIRDPGLDSTKLNYYV